MNENLTAIAKDNMVRISPAKLSILVPFLNKTGWPSLAIFNIDTQ